VLVGDSLVTVLLFWLVSHMFKAHWLAVPKPDAQAWSASQAALAN
jgi:hypothetical protein